MKSVKKNICREEFISRIPGLFPYLDFNEFGNIVKHRATDSVDGCYAKMIPDLIVDGETIPYRVLIRDYYEKNPETWTQEKEDFVNTVIGKFKISDFETHEVNGEEVEWFVFDEIATLVPEYIYAAEARSLLNEMILLKKACNSYRNQVSVKSTELCCDCDEFINRGGDTMIALLEYLISYADEVSDDYYNNKSTADASYGFNINLNGSYEDIGYFTPYTDEKIREKNDGEIYPKITKQSTISIGIDNIVNTDSKLKSLRCYTTYMNTREQYEVPDTDEDWLYFYQKGYIANYETVNDEHGNIMTINDEDKITEDGYVINLLAYGSLIDDIEVDTEKRTIKFTYYINAHLKAEVVSDNLYKSFARESGGVKQTETYYYGEGGELDDLITSGEFEEYITGTIPRRFETRKCAFSVIGSSSLNKKRIWDKTVDIPYQQSSLEYERDNTVEIYNADIFKEDYLIGVSFKPEVESSVNIQRGNNAAFERHIRLGEVKTLEDMENYMNGSFFNIQEAT